MSNEVLLRRDHTFVARTPAAEKARSASTEFLEWLASMHIPVPDNVLSCRYFQTQQARHCYPQ